MAAPSAASATDQKEVEVYEAATEVPEVERLLASREEAHVAAAVKVPPAQVVRAASSMRMVEVRPTHEAAAAPQRSLMWCATVRSGYKGVSCCIWLVSVV